MSKLNQHVKIMPDATNIFYVLVGCFGPCQTAMIELLRKNSKRLLSARKAPSEMSVSVLNKTLHGNYIPYQSRERKREEVVGRWL